MRPPIRIQRLHRQAPPLLAFMTAVVVTLLAVAPVVANVDLGDKGSVGPHTLIDSMTAASVRCSYATISDGTAWRGKLAHIDVQPPLLRSISGRQLVGWRFIVHRYKNNYAPGRTHSIWDPNVVTYRSPVQTATATEDADAAFRAMGVDVKVPAGTLKRNWAYNIVVKMFWYRPNGNIEGIAKHLLSKEEEYRQGHVAKITLPWCYGRLTY